MAAKASSTRDLEQLEQLLAILNAAGVTAYKTADTTIVLSGTTRFPADLPEDIEHEIVAESDPAVADADDDGPTLQQRLMSANFKPREAK